MSKEKLTLEIEWLNCEGRKMPKIKEVVECDLSKCSEFGDEFDEICEIGTDLIQDAQQELEKQFDADLEEIIDKFTDEIYQIIDDDSIDRYETVERLEEIEEKIWSEMGKRGWNTPVEEEETFYGYLTVEDEKGRDLTADDQIFSYFDSCTGDKDTYAEVDEDYFCYTKRFCSPMVKYLHRFMYEGW